MTTIRAERSQAGSADSLKARYQHVLAEIDRAARVSGRTGKDVMLVAVSKYTGIDQIRELVQLGHRDFGENHVQALVQRSAAVDEIFSRTKAMPVLKPAAGDAMAPIRWHMIGRLQRNKARRAVELCRLIHSVDNARVAEDVQIAANKLSKTVDILLQVNTSGEESKSGIAPAAVMHVLDMVETMINVRVRGLMTMAPHDDNPAEARPTFVRLRELFEEARRIGAGGNHFNILSMGMSADYQIAIEEGANLVRVGSAIFGAPTHTPDDSEDDGESDSDE